MVSAHSTVFVNSRSSHVLWVVPIFLHSLSLSDFLPATVFLVVSLAWIATNRWAQYKCDAYRYRIWSCRYLLAVGYHFGYDTGLLRAISSPPIHSLHCCPQVNYLIIKRVISSFFQIYSRRGVGYSLDSHFKCGQIQYLFKIHWKVKEEKITFCINRANYVHVWNTDENKILWKMDTYEKFTKKCHIARFLVETKRTFPPHCSISNCGVCFFRLYFYLSVPYFDVVCIQNC